MFRRRSSGGMEAKAELPAVLAIFKFPPKPDDQAYSYLIL
jgi:hypothetical protein